ncbi:hypothetical protein [Natrinema salifodinae]|uniref:hypothetical protein n=1 Tax=Natrinema salifodinae TaxID=1202768 RepID=UPI001160DFE6|nr:hypothetical protein [Natrinema salifodinae]
MSSMCDSVSANDATLIDLGIGRGGGVASEPTQPTIDACDHLEDGVRAGCDRSRVSRVTREARTAPVPTRDEGRGGDRA